jgi:hypothetical protein
MNIIQYFILAKKLTKLKCVDAEFKETYNLIKIIPVNLLFFENNKLKKQ